ncbi:MAG: 2Fe-2S iron-sulfur cluster-binding protein, partial [Desulfobacterales bacterium]|nr:2Fe-2S iron-sulfur cluster-binding protein [Desulfobacterales bacterium]
MASKTCRIAITVNGERRSLEIRPGETLLGVLRNHLGLTGTKEGCGSGDCGACTVLLNGLPVNACLVLGVDCDG